MTDVLERMHEEVKKARFRNDSKLKSRLHEAIREIEYFRWAASTLARLDDSLIGKAVRDFARITEKGEKIGPAHPIVVSVNPQNESLKRKIAEFISQRRPLIETTVHAQFATQSKKTAGD